MEPQERLKIRRQISCKDFQMSMQSIADNCYKSYLEKREQKSKSKPNLKQK